MGSGHEVRPLWKGDFGWKMGWGGERELAMRRAGEAGWKAGLPPGSPPSGCPRLLCCLPGPAWPQERRVIVGLQPRPLLGWAVISRIPTHRTVLATVQALNICGEQTYLLLRSRQPAGGMLAVPGRWPCVNAGATAESPDGNWSAVFNLLVELHGVHSKCQFDSLWLSPTLALQSL